MGNKRAYSSGTLNKASNCLKIHFSVWNNQYFVRDFAYVKASVHGSLFFMENGSSMFLQSKTSNLLI